MKAVIIHRYGPANELQLAELSKPILKPNEVLVKNQYTTVNPWDYKVRNGSMKFMTGNKFRLPLYLAPFLGVLKILGGITIVMPALKRFHEAAYAGLIFYFVGATYVVIASGGTVGTYSVTSIILTAIVISYLTSLKKKPRHFNNPSGKSNKDSEMLIY